MGGASGDGEWDFSDFEDDDGFESIPGVEPDNGKKSKKTKLDIRRKLEDRLERRRLEEQIGALDDDWFD